MQLLVMLYLCAVASGAITAFGVLRPAIYFSIAADDAAADAPG